MVKQFGTPGARLTRKNRLAQQLMQQEQNAPPITAHSQGLASLLRNFMIGQSQRGDIRDFEAAQTAMATPRGEQPTLLPYGVQGPPQAPVDPFAARTEAIGALEGGYKPQAVAQLGRQREEYQAGQRTRAQQLQDIANQRTQGIEDYRTKLGIEQEFAAPTETFETVENPYGRGGVGQKSSITGQITSYQGPEKDKSYKIIEGADKRKYWAEGPDKGKLVLEGVQTPQEKFFDLISDPASDVNLEGGAGADILGTGDAYTFDLGDGDVMMGADAPPGFEGTQAAPQPSVRDLFNSLPTEIQTGIKMSADPMKAFSAHLLKSKGLDITVDENGNIQITQGGSKYGYGKKATGTIQEKLFNSREGLARISGIEQSFRPEFQQIPTRFAAAFAAGKEFLGMDLNPDDKALVEDYSTYKMQAFENINRYIKEITGAQMSEAEAKRLRRGVPDPGDDWYSGDSPTEFGSKLKAQTRLLRASAARYQFALKNGWDMNPNNLEKSMPLDSVESMIEERGAALERQMRARQPNLPDSAIQGFVMQQLNAEFGMGGQ